MVVRAPGGAPLRTLFVLHGIFGSGRNWRNFAGRLVLERPEWEVVLVDLRGHGESAAAPGPHTIAACAADLDALAHALGRPAEAVAGHSFGGKVAMAWAAAAPEGIRQLWILDSPPGSGPAGGKEPADSEVGRMVRVLKTIPLPVARRALVAEEIAAAGVAPPVARWMATNLRTGTGGHVWTFDLAAVEDLLADYWRADLWPFLEVPPPGLAVHAVRGGRSDRWTAPDVSQHEALAARGLLGWHVLPGAGHWLQVDDPAGLLALMKAWL